MIQTELMAAWRATSRQQTTNKRSSGIHICYNMVFPYCTVTCTVLKYIRWVSVPPPPPPFHSTIAPILSRGWIRHEEAVCRSSQVLLAIGSHRRNSNGSHQIRRPAVAELEEARGLEREPTQRTFAAWLKWRKCTRKCSLRWTSVTRGRWDPHTALWSPTSFAQALWGNVPKAYFVFFLLHHHLLLLRWEIIAKLTHRPRQTAS